MQLFIFISDWRPLLFKTGSQLHHFLLVCSLIKTCENRERHIKRQRKARRVIKCVFISVGHPDGGVCALVSGSQLLSFAHGTQVCSFSRDTTTGHLRREEAASWTQDTAFWMSSSVCSMVTTTLRLRTHSQIDYNKEK